MALVRKKQEEPEQPPDPNARFESSPEDQAKAQKWFVRGRELGEKRQFDYAIEYYVNGLEFWPDAIEDGCKPLHGCAVARKSTGGKKPGFKDTMKRSLTDKNPKQALVNALWLFGQDPDNLAYLEGVVRNAGRLRAEDAGKWSGAILQRALDANQKASAKQFQALVQLMEELGDRAAARGEGTFGVEAYQIGVDALRLWSRRFPKDQGPENALKSLSTKLTILKGKYQDSESFRESIVDADEQRELHDQNRTVQSEDRLSELVAKAEAEYRKDPNAPGALKRLVEMLCRREDPEEEARAIGLLVDEFKSTDDYRWKQAADDIRMKQLAREVREAVKAGDEEAIKEKQVAQLRFELNTFKDRVQRYPTDNRLKYEYAVRNFRAGRFDDAIPMFQQARNDPKNRIACGMYLGRCFYRKNYFDQAVSTFQEALKDHPYSDDELAKTLLYWLGRAQEAVGSPTAARETYGSLLSLEYNYKDVRQRLDNLPAGR